MNAGGGNGAVPGRLARTLPATVAGRERVRDFRAISADRLCRPVSSAITFRAICAMSVVSERLRVLAKTKSFEPLRYVVRHAASLREAGFAEAVEERLRHSRMQCGIALTHERDCQVRHQFQCIPYRCSGVFHSIGLAQ